jgi:porin
MRRRRPLHATPIALALGLSAAGPSQGMPSAAAEQAPSPIEFAAQYTADLFHNAGGGLREGTAYLDYAELAVGIDATQAVGIPSLRLFASFAHANRTTFSDAYVGDAMVASNIDTDSVPEVLEAWLDWGFAAAGPGSLRLGLYDLNTEFDALESRGLFLNSAYGIGQEIAQTGHNGPSIFPSTALAARVAWSPQEHWLLKLAVLDAVPGDPDDRGRSRLHLSSSEGALWITEAKAAAGNVRVALGYWRYSGGFDDLLHTGADGEPRLRDDNAGSYIAAELASRAATGMGEPRWMAFIRAGNAEERINSFDRFLAAGILLRNDWPGENGSYLGLAASEARVSSAYRAQRSRDGVATDPHERNLELTWRIPLNDHLVLQPDLQYVVNPGADPALDDALVIGLRLELHLER